MSQTNEHLLGTREQSTLIAEVPQSLLKGLSSATDKLIELEKVPMITHVPGFETSTYRSPEQVVEEINQRLATRDPSLGTPEVRAGGPDGIITQRGE